MGRPRKRGPKKGSQPSYAFKDLKEMSCFAEFDEKVRAGVAVEEIARWLPIVTGKQIGRAHV